MISDAKTDAQDKKARVPPPADLPAPGGPPAPAPPTLPPAPLPKPASGPKIIPAGADATLVVTQAALAVAEEAAWSSHLEAARNPDAEVSRQGVKGVASFLTHRSEVFRRKAAGALADLGAVAELVATDLREAVKDPDGEVRKSARLALEKIDEAVASAKAAKTRAAVLALAQDLKAKESPKRIKALEQIAAFGPEANNVVGEQLIEALVDKVPGVQKAASDALEKVNPKVHAHVISLLYGMDRSAALSDLGKLGAEAAIAVPLILYLHANPPRTAPKTGSVPGPVCPELATIAKIAPKDKRFAAAVLATIAAPVPRETTGAFVVPDDGGPALGPRATKRVEAIKLLSVIEATPEAKVKAALAALEDGYGAHQVIAALEKMGKDAAPALPALKKLKLSPDDAIRKAVTKAIEKIE